MEFATAAKNDARFTRTENGAVALNTTGNRLLDFFSTVGALRNADLDRILNLFENAYAEDKTLATKIVFYARDIRGGLGERKTFRTLLRYMANNHPEAVAPNVHLIPGYGRYDDWYALVGTQCERKMWEEMGYTLFKDCDILYENERYNDNKPISLLAKWIKSADTSSKESRRLGILTAKNLGYDVPEFKRLVRKLRKHIKIVEQQMSANQWGEIEYSHVPSRAMLNYRNAFLKHDCDRFSEFTDAALNGKTNVHSGTLYPYDIVEAVLKDKTRDTSLLEAQWRQLPDYVGEGENIVVMADTSGSMIGRPMNTALSLAVYFAERNSGPYHNLFMSFSEYPKFHEIYGETLKQKLESIDKRDWMMNTDLHAAFKKILKLAVDNDIPQSEMPKALVVISDMEIDACGNREWSFYDKMAHKFEKHGYKIPNVIFWNVNSRNNTYHADANRKGVQLFSGSAASTFANVINSLDKTPVQAMLDVLLSDRYAPIEVES